MGFIGFFLKKQPVYKQLALGEQIAKYFSVFSTLSLRNNKNYRLKDYCLKRITGKISDHKYRF